MLVTQPVLSEFNSFLMQTFSFVPINLQDSWTRDWSALFLRFQAIQGDQFNEKLTFCFLFFLDSTKFLNICLQDDLQSKNP